MNFVALNLKPHNPSYNIGHNGQHHPFGTLYITSFEKKMWNVYAQAGGQSMKSEKIRYRDLYSVSIPYPIEGAIKDFWGFELISFRRHKT
jgi:hypothetical protein